MTLDFRRIETEVRKSQRPGETVEQAARRIADQRFAEALDGFKTAVRTFEEGRSDGKA